MAAPPLTKVGAIGPGEDELIKVTDPEFGGLGDGRFMKNVSHTAAGATSSKCSTPAALAITVTPLLVTVKPRLRSTSGS